MNKKYFNSILFIMAAAILAGFIFSDNGRYNTGTVSTDNANVQYFSDAVVKYVDSLNGANDTNALKSRGYKVYKNTTVTPVGPIWFQGNPASIGFNAYNGPANGFLGTDYNSGGTGVGNIDNWLVTPPMNVAAGDSLVFFSGAYNSTTYPDSIRVMYSPLGDSTPSGASWVELGRFRVNSYQPSLVVPWQRKAFGAPVAGATGRFAIRYCIVNGGAGGANGSSVGIDMITVEGNPSLLSCSYNGTAQTSGTTGGFFTVRAVNNLVVWACAAGATIRKTTDGGATWTNGNPNPGVITGDVYNIEAIDANTAWCTTSPGATFIYKTTNGGTNWTQVYTEASPSFINAIDMVTPLNGYATGDPVGGTWRILTTVDGGSTWTNLPTAPAGTGDGRNNCMQVSLPNIWFGTGQGTVVFSTNAGVTWATSPTGITTQILGIHFNSSTVGLCGGASMMRTTNGGVNWSTVTAPGTGNITGIDGAGNDFFYCRGSVIYRSTDAGLTFSTVYTVTPTATLNDLRMVNDPNGCLVGWTDGSAGSMTKITGTPTGVVINNNEIPKSYGLQQNYPNPFNPTTNIKFSVPSTGLVKLTVFDVLGREVATLLNEVKPAGNYTADFNAANLSSGVYFYSLEAGDFKQTKKMLLVK